jgi:hypothetical protein
MPVPSAAANRWDLGKMATPVAGAGCTCGAVEREEETLICWFSGALPRFRSRELRTQMLVPDKLCSYATAFWHLPPTLRA